MPPVTQALLIVNVLVFFVVQQLGPTIIVQFGLWPWATELFRPWQVVSYAFLHGSLTHLAFNMFGLWMFGSELERVWGTRRMLQFYFASVLVAAAAQLIVTGVMGSQAPTVGASGGLFGLLIGFAMVFPRRKITPLIPPIPMRAPVFVGLYGAVELTLGVTGSASGVAHFAHLGGLLGGWLMMRYWRGQAPFGRPRR
ncbi:MAG: rhomboid family intramembrane serine protease [Burkholderiaceae bacterium]|nr:rhomboid family intramembrane serine protease [Rhodoferax sp.]MCP5261530.1 rhomboid family intramembrane serine protease [Rhodoferax sp.]